MKTIGYEPIYRYTSESIDKTHKIYRFKNGYGVSVAHGKDVPGGENTGHCTFAVIQWPMGCNIDDYKISRDTPITVLNNLPDEDVNVFLQIVDNFGNESN